MTPQSSDITDGNRRRGRKVTLRYRSKCVKDNKRLRQRLLELEDKVACEKKKAAKYKKRWQRQKAVDEMKLKKTPENNLTPNSKTKKMLQELDSDLSRHSSGNKRMSLLVRSKVARTLKFHNVMTHSIINHYSKVKSTVEKRHIASALSSKLIQRYRLRSAVARTLGLSAAQRVLTKRIIAENTNRFKIEAFFLSDDVSRNTAGTKETVTRKKIKNKNGICCLQ